MRKSSIDSCPLFGTHGGGTAVGEQVYEHVIRMHVKEVIPGFGQNLFPFGPGGETYRFDCLDFERFDDGLHLRFPLQ